MELRTERLVLRDYLASDAAAVFAYQSEPLYLEHYTDSPPTRDDVEVFVALMRSWASETPRTKYQLAITLDGAVIGSCGVRAEGDAAEFGCELDPAMWGRGYAREASRAILAFAERTLGPRRILARTTAANRAAVELATSLGFTRVSPELFERLG